MNKNELIIMDENEIKNKIYTIRGFQVMLDRDLSELHNVKAIRSREQIKRNPKRFSADFMFQLNDKEIDYLLSQNAIPSRKHLDRSSPLTFVGQEVASLSGILKGNIAVGIRL